MKGLETKYSDKMSFKIVGFDAGDSPKLIAKYKLGKHGMIITDSSGKLLWKESSHFQEEPIVVKAIEAALGN